jgi:hypothetical protein
MTSVLREIFFQNDLKLLFETGHLFALLFLLELFLHYFFSLLRK